MTDTPPRQETPAVTDDLQELIAKAQAAYAAMTPEQKAAHDAAQRESFARGNVELDRLEREERMTRRMMTVDEVNGLIEKIKQLEDALTAQETVHAERLDCLATEIAVRRYDLEACSVALTTAKAQAYERAAQLCDQRADKLRKTRPWTAGELDELASEIRMEKED